MKTSREKAELHCVIRTLAEGGNGIACQIARWSTGNAPSQCVPTYVRGQLRADPSQAESRGTDLTEDDDRAEQRWISHYGAIVRSMTDRANVSCELRGNRVDSQTFLTFLFEADDGDSFPVDIYVTGTTAFHLGQGWLEAHDIDEGVRIATTLLNAIGRWDLAVATPERR